VCRDPVGLATWLRRRAERDGDRTALSFAGKTLSFTELQLSDRGKAEGRNTHASELRASNVNWMLAVNYNAEHAALTSAPLYAGTLLDDIERYRVT
jgi:hypothetical protein